MTLTVSYNLTTTRSQFAANTYTTQDEFLSDTIGLTTADTQSPTTLPIMVNYILADFYTADSVAVGSYQVPASGIGATSEPAVTQLSGCRAPTATTPSTVPAAPTRSMAATTRTRCMAAAETMC